MANGFQAPQFSPQDVDNEGSDSDDSDTDMTHPNKYPVEIEFHKGKQCSYQRQPTRLVKILLQNLLNTGKELRDNDHSEYESVFQSNVHFLLISYKCLKAC